jgi:hypothetical protein
MIYKQLSGLLYIIFSFPTYDKAILLFGLFHLAVLRFALSILYFLADALPLEPQFHPKMFPCIIFKFFGGTGI